MLKKRTFICAFFVLLLGVLLSVIALFVENKNNNNDLIFTTKIFTTKSQDSVTTTIDELISERPELTAPAIGELVISGNGHTFNIIKTDFEERYSEEFLMDIISMLGMRFGGEQFTINYENTETVVNSLISNCILTYKFPYHAIYTENEELIKKGNEELNFSFPDINHSSRSFVEIDTLNAYFEDMLGPNIKDFTSEDFLTIEEATDKYGKAFLGNFNEGYNEIRYLPKSELLYFVSADIGFSSCSSYIYDIKEINGDYFVYTLGYDEIYYNDFTFESHQAAAFDSIWCSDYIENYIYKFGCTDNGNVYLKSVDQNFLFSDEFSDYTRITKDTVVISDYSYLFDPVVIGELKTDDYVYYDSVRMYRNKEYAYIITSDFAGYIEKSCLQN